MASITRKDIRRGIRNKMQAWPLGVDALQATISATDQTIKLVSGAGLSDRVIMEVVPTLEAIRVVTPLLPPQTAPLYPGCTACIRGDRGTTAAIAQAGAVVNIYPFWGWLDADLNDYINKACDWMGDGMVYTMALKANTFLQGFKDFAAPAGCYYPTGDIVKRIEALDTDGVWKQILGWKHTHDRIYFNKNLDADLQVRCWVQQRQVRLTDDTTVLDLDRAQEVLELYSAGRMLEELLANRSRYYDYSASLNDRASSADELQRLSYYFLNQAVILRDQLSRPGLSGYAGIQKA